MCGCESVAALAKERCRQKKSLYDIYESTITTGPTIKRWIRLALFIVFYIERRRRKYFMGSRLTHVQWILNVRLCRVCFCCCCHYIHVNEIHMMELGLSTQIIHTKFSVDEIPADQIQCPMVIYPAFEWKESGAGVERERNKRKWTNMMAKEVTCAHMPLLRDIIR